MSLLNRSMYYVFDATEAALPSLAKFPNVCDLNIGRCHSIRGAALIRHLERHGKCIQRLTLVRVQSHVLELFVSLFFLWSFMTIC